MNTEDTRLADQTPSLSAQTLKVCLVDGAALDTPLLRTALLDAFTPFRPDISTASCADLEQVGCADVNLLYWTPAFGTADISAWTSTDVPLVALFQPMPDVPRADTTKLAIDAGACATVTLPVNRAELRRAASKVLTLVTPKADGPVAKVESGRQGLAADAPAPITPLERKILGDMIAGSAAVKPNALPSPLLIVGENGTGKALAARAVHMDSVGATHPFVTVNCGSLSGTMGLETLGLLLPQDTLGPQETLGMNAPD
ncbi:MAG: sigma 54-interacting transcriptional regulator, partial [Pseudomonadota bacterium]